MIVDNIHPKTRINIFATNTASNVFFKSIMFFIGFITTPYVVGYMGVENYGVWVFVVGFISYFAIFTNGIPGGVVKFISENKENVLQKNKIIFVSIFFYCVVGFVISSILFLGGDFLVSLFNVNKMQNDDISLMLKIGAIFILFLWPINVFQAYLTAMVKFTVINLISLFSVIFGFITLFTCLYLQIDLPIIYLIYCIAGLIISSFYFFYVKLTFKGLKLSFQYFDFSLAKSLFKFTTGLLILEIISALAMQTDNFIIAFFLPLENISYYNITTKITYLFRGNVYGMLLTVIIPMIFEAQKKNDRTFINKMIFKGTRYFISLIIPLVVLFIIIMKSFITLWMGPDFGQYGLWGSVYMAQFLFSPVTGVVGSVVIGLSKLKPMQIMSFVMVIINLVLSIILVQLIGFPGVIVGTVTAQYIGFPFMFYIYCKYSGISWKELVKDTWQVFFIIIFFFLLPGMILINLIPLSWFNLISFSIIFLISIYSVLFFVFIERDDKIKIYLLLQKIAKSKKR